ncbi:MAG: DUF1848 family protein [Muribaculaceae bacterium]|nr:DUF1848 family protein [Muribaculaceae bacterium]
MKHDSIQISTHSGKIINAQAPLIISTSRATDIPAFYADWFFSRLEEGYVKWTNPFNGKDSYISFRNTRFIVFWSKNPSSLLPYLKYLKDKGIGCYLQYTLNDYDNEKLEPNVPNLFERIDTYKRLVDNLGAERVIWRFDPMILTENIGINELLSKVTNIGNLLQGYTKKLVFSFADIMTYKKVARNLDLHNIKYKEWDCTAMTEFAKQLSNLNANNWKFFQDNRT